MNCIIYKRFANLGLLPKMMHDTCDAGRHARWDETSVWTSTRARARIETRLMCVSPELVESVRIGLEHLPHVEVPCVGFVPLFQFAVDRVAVEPHDEKIPLFFRSKDAKVKYNRSNTRSVIRGVRRKSNDKCWEPRPSRLWHAYNDDSGSGSCVAPPSVTKANPAWPRPLWHWLRWWNGCNADRQYLITHFFDTVCEGSRVIPGIR